MRSSVAHIHFPNMATGSGVELGAAGSYIYEADHIPTNCTRLPRRHREGGGRAVPSHAFAAYFRSHTDKKYIRQKSTLTPRFFPPKRMFCSTTRINQVKLYTCAYPNAPLRPPHLELPAEPAALVRRVALGDGRARRVEALHLDEGARLVLGADPLGTRVRAMGLARFDETLLVASAERCGRMRGGGVAGAGAGAGEVRRGCEWRHRSEERAEGAPFGKEA